MSKATIAHRILIDYPKLELFRVQRGVIQRAALRIRRDGGDQEELKRLDSLQLELKKIYYECGGQPYDPTHYWGSKQ